MRLPSNRGDNPNRRRNGRLLLLYILSVLAIAAIIIGPMISPEVKQQRGISPERPISKSVLLGTCTADYNMTLQVEQTGTQYRVTLSVIPPSGVRFDGGSIAFGDTSPQVIVKSASASVSHVYSTSGPFEISGVANYSTKSGSITVSSCMLLVVATGTNCTSTDLTGDKAGAYALPMGTCEVRLFGDEPTISYPAGSIFQVTVQKDGSALISSGQAKVQKLLTIKGASVLAATAATNELTADNQPYIWLVFTGPASETVLLTIL